MMHEALHGRLTEQDDDPVSVGPLFVAFDLEITKEIPEGTEDWKTVRPLGISCAATVTSCDYLKLWHGWCDEQENPYPASMSVNNVHAMIDYLYGLHRSGYTIVTWNGLGFDFDVLAEEARDGLYRDLCVEMALNHVDLGFHMLCDKGFMIGLDAAARGLGVEGKTEGMHGDMAPIMWRGGREAQDKVLEYVSQDVRATANVYRAVLEKKMIPWISRSNRRNYWILQTNKPLTVIEALKTPLPDTSWMTSTRKREDFYGWTGYEAKDQ